MTFISYSKPGFLLVVACVLVLFSRSSYSDAETLNDLVKRSDIVAVVVVTAATDEHAVRTNAGCGLTYRATVATNVKGAREGDEVEFRLARPLAMSGQYLVFLEANPLSVNQPLLPNLLSIRSRDCNKSKIDLTMVEPAILIGKNMRPPMFFESRLIPSLSGSRVHGKASEKFVASTSLARLFDNQRLPSACKDLSSHEVEIQRARGAYVELATDAERFLQCLQEVVRKLD